MSNNSSIEWTEATWNTLAGCTPVSSGCLNCYAATMSNRLGAMGQEAYAGLTVKKVRLSMHGNPDGENDAPGDRGGFRQVFNGTVRCLPGRLTIPLWWKKPRRIFVNSMSDTFHKDVPFEFIDQIFAVMATCPQHTFQVLTKRPERMAEYLNRGGPLLSETMYHLDRIIETSPVWDAAVREDCGALRWPLPNVWLGTSCENQAAADERIPHLANCPAVVRFLSVEPLLGPISFGISSRHIDWAIVGCESRGNSPGRNSEDYPQHAASIIDHFRGLGVPVFHKQMPMNKRVSHDPAFWPEHMRLREMPA